MVLVKIDHILFKSNAYASVIAQKSVSEFSDHKQCRLGKWYINEGKARYGHTKNFSSIDAPHALVHRNVHKNINLIDEDKVLSKENETTIINNFASMEEESNKLFAILDDVVNELDPTNKR
ncbi:CZB domain-containing protein [Sulfurimonas sp.]|uniref:CZB domain-containing protein n=1 Tax=Sulfurimonas sp. TaxID=2022749 RepID=UPI00356A58B0